jgi:hypothetical protein
VFLRHVPVAVCVAKLSRRRAQGVTAYFDLLSYLYLSRLIHDASLIILILSVPLDHCYHLHLPTQHMLTFIGLPHYLDT